MHGGFYDSLTKLEVISSEPCKCGDDDCPNISCRSCIARQELDGVYELIQHALEMIEEDYTPKKK